MRRLPPATMRGKIDQALKLTRLSELPGIEQRYRHQLSGGQRQRVALARSLVTEPKVLLLDEPFGALDKKLRESMQVELRLLQQDLKITTIFVTHDQEEALTLADRIAVMKDGQIEQIGTPSDIYENPKSHFVADFIGVSNFFQAEVEQISNGHTNLRTVRGLPVQIQTPLDRTLHQGEHLHLALRPEKVAMCSPREATAEGQPVTITHVVYLGMVTHYYTRTPQGEELIVYVQNQERTHGQRAFGVGDTVHLSWKPEHVLVLEEKDA